MAFKHCEYRRCGKLFDAAHHADFFCTPEHRAEEHRALAPFSTPPTLSPRKPTMSLGEAETALAGRRTPQDTARLFAEQEATMIAKLALGRPQRRNRTR